MTSRHADPSPTHRSRRALAVVAAALIITITGCGTSSSGIKASGDDETTTTVGEETTTTASDDEEPTTTVEDEEPTTTVDETTTTERRSTTTSGGSGGTWPAQAKDSFMSSCTGGSEDMKPICECVFRAVEPRVSVADLMDVGTAGSLPDDLEAMVTSYATECAADPTSH